MTAKNKAVIKGQITYHDTGTSEHRSECPFTAIRLHGTVENVLVDDDLIFTAADLRDVRPRSAGCGPVRGHLSVPGDESDLSAARPIHRPGVRSG